MKIVNTGYKRKVKRETKKEKRENMRKFDFKNFGKKLTKGLLLPTGEINEGQRNVLTLNMELQVFQKFRD